MLLGLLNKLMEMQWYKWLTAWMVTKYLSSKTYYDIATKDDIDNPDERIQDNVAPFVSAIISFPTRVLGTILALTTNAVLLIQVSSSMTAFVVAYSVVALVLQTILYWPLIRKNFDAVAANADFRFGLLRIRENAETIAFFRGEAMEKGQVSRRLDRVVHNQMDIYYYQLKTGLVTKVFEEVWTIAPLILIYPLYFKGMISFGTIALATGAAASLRGSIGTLNDYIPFLAGVAPRVVRLSQIVERYEHMESTRAHGPGNIEIRRGDHIHVDGVSFQTPGGEQQLARDLSIVVRPGDKLVITGQTGVGKSSMLRSMAGLWTKGKGSMTMPAQEDIMFVPQKPYMMLGSLRAQLLYPRGDIEMRDEDIQKVLERVCLADLIDKAGGLDNERDWSKVLSLGEQQRVSFARILISNPKFVFLDESTSAVDIRTEAQLYSTLMAENVTFISVGHRETILKFHDKALQLLVGGAWEIVEASRVPQSKNEPLGAAL